MRLFDRQLYNWRMSDESANNAKLTMVPTPIGNLGDMTLRAIKVLEMADAIYAEDTRMVQKLLSALELKTDARIFRLDENLMSSHANDVAELVAAGKNVAYCTDAGMPGVSDPGLKLVARLREKGLPVEVLPGASASIVAYVSSATQNPHFYFGAFLPRKDAQQRVMLEGLANLDAALVFYESPKRLSKTLETIASVFPYRNVTVCRELTKLHEEVITANSKEVAELFATREARGEIKGECAIVIDGPVDAEALQSEEAAVNAALEDAAQMIDDGVSSKDAIKVLVDKFGISKNKAYEIYLEKKSKIDD